MRTLLALAIALPLLIAGCTASADRQARLQAMQVELDTQREELSRLQAEFDRERQRLSRSLASIQSRLEDLDRTLRLASAEIWGDGSSTGAHLAMAERTLTAARSDVDALARALRSPVGSR